MANVFYTCNVCKQALTLVTTETYPANMVYAPPNSTSYYYMCEHCGNLLYGEETPGKPVEWQELNKQTFDGRIEGVKQRTERSALREGKEKLIAEKPQIVKRIDETQQKINGLDLVLDEFRAKVVELSDKYDENQAERDQLQNTLENDRHRLAEIDELLKDLIHIK